MTVTEEVSLNLHKNQGGSDNLFGSLLLYVNKPSRTKQNVVRTPATFPVITARFKTATAPNPCMQL